MRSGGSSSLPFPPPGFRFEPTERELVGYFLANRINGGHPVDEKMIKECDVYEEEPSKIWERFHDPVSLGRDLYLFMELRKMSPNSKNFCRKIRSPDEKSTSTWHEQNKSTRLIRVNGMVAERKAFTYRNSNNSDRSVSWILHEYKFHFSNIVLCRLRRNQLQLPNNFDAEVREFEAERNPPSKKRRRRLDFDASTTGAANSDSYFDSDSSKIVHQAKRLRREKSSSLPIHCSNGTRPTQVPEFNIDPSACLGIDVPAVGVASSSMGTIACEHVEASAPSSSGKDEFFTCDFDELFGENLSFDFDELFGNATNCNGETATAEITNSFTNSGLGQPPSNQTLSNAEFHPAFGVAERQPPSNQTTSNAEFDPAFDVAVERNDGTIDDWWTQLGGFAQGNQLMYV